MHRNLIQYHRRVGSGIIGSCGFSKEGVLTVRYVDVSHMSHLGERGAHSRCFENASVTNDEPNNGCGGTLVDVDVLECVELFEWGSG